MAKLGCDSDGHLNTSVVNWMTWKQQMRRTIDNLIDPKAPPDNIIVQITLRQKTRLVAKCKHAVFWSTRSLGASLDFLLLKNEGIKFSFRSLNFGPPHPAMFEYPIGQLAKGVKFRIFITSTDNFGAKTAEHFPNQRTGGNCREDGADKSLQETVAVCGIHS